MNTTLSLVPSLLAIATLALAGHGVVQAQGNPTQIINRLTARYSAVEALRASFTQSMTSPYTTGEESLSGTVVLQGDKYRVETGRQTLVTDGEVTWIYNADENQVLINHAADDEGSFSINDFLFNHAERYNATEARVVQLQGQRHHMVRLKPKRTDGFFTDLTLWVRDSDMMITQVEVVDVNETKMSFHLTNIEVNPVVSAQTFTFRPPATAQVIDLRS
jgi:outer membrane lipoprotein carrier protein